jgi:hypothetical protein
MELNKKEIFGAKFLYNVQNNDVVENIRKLYNNDNKNIDTELLKLYHNEIMTDNQRIKDILTFELLNYQPTDNHKSDSISELINITLNELKRYQNIVDECYFEDDEWIICNDNQNRFKMKYNQMGVYNTINVVKYYKSKQGLFLKMFVKHINKFIFSNSKIIFDYKIYEDEGLKIKWILFLFEKRD